MTWRAVLIALLLARAACADPITAPAQPATGPGGADYAHARVVRSRHGSGGEQYWIFSPADPVPAQASVVVFVHGWAALTPDPYEGWIRHLVRRGNLVIYPRYQADLLTLPNAMTESAIAAVRDAFARLERDGPVRPDRGRFAIVGHSMGGAIGANLTGRAQELGLPPVRALMVVQPGDGSSALNAGASMLDDPHRIPADCLLLAVVGDRDELVGDRMARRIYRGARTVPSRNKDLVTVHSDEHGTVPLIADHMSPLASRYPAGEARRATDLGSLQGLFSWAIADNEQRRAWLAGVAPDALDHLGYWRLFDALAHAAFTGEDRDAALGGGPRQIDMGRWSDGVPVAPLESERKKREGPW